MRKLRFFAPLSLHASIRLLLTSLTLSATLLTGCIHDVLHQKVLLTAPNVTIDTTFLRDASHPGSKPGDTNHAVVEFLESGDLADPCNAQAHPEGKPKCQLEFAKDFVRVARNNAAVDHKRLAVITFVHGNMNYAEDTADNMAHFRQFITCLNLGTEAYRAQPQYTKLSAKEQEKVSGCGDKKLIPGLPVLGKFYPSSDIRFVGVFIAWRGKRLRYGLAMRENVARDIADSNVFLDALYQVRDAAKMNLPTAAPAARFILAGHSFGGLIVERSSLRIYRQELREAKEEDFMPCTSDPQGPKGFRPFADMTFTINPAVYGVEAKELIETFQEHESSFCFSPQIAPSLQRPFVVSFVSRADYWSHGLGNWLRHTFGSEHERPENFHDLRDVEQETPASALVFHHTAAFLTFFQNLCFLDTNNSGERACDAEYPAVTKDSGNLAIHPAPTHLSPTGPQAKQFDALKYLYVRYDCNPIGAPDNQYWKHCLSTEPAQHRDQLHVWNRTPYWISIVKPEVIANHDDFWNVRFVSLISGVSGAFPTLTVDQVEPRPAVLSEPPAP